MTAVSESLPTDLVRPSRDGDQFHYLWAARRVLAMLRPDAELVAVSIEGVAPDEGTEFTAGLDVIDVAEYRGSTEIDADARVTYVQLKHSTRRVDQPWQVSGLKPTIRKFADRYLELVTRFGIEDVALRFTFAFETNRPIAETVTTAMHAIAAGDPGAEDAPLAKATSLTGDALRSFIAQLKLNAHTADYLEQRRLLGSDISAYLPDGDRDAPLQLKDLVTRKATSEFATNPLITRHDLLQAIGSSAAELYPAPSLIYVPSELVDREQLSNIVAEIVAHPEAIIIQADGGVGKSVLAARIGDHLPAGSVALVYDCFGNGSYRSASGSRHRPKEGLVQLANELAGCSLCDLLIRTSKADAKAYVRAFCGRIAQAAATLRNAESHALLCLVIDAADNAETAALEAPLDGPSFGRLLLREQFPDNVRLVLTARTHRVDSLDPPPSTKRIDLLPFSLEETAKNIRATFPNASARDVEEFHRLTSSNPRVQAAALAGVDTLTEVLSGLGPDPLTVQDTIAKLLHTAVAKVRYETPKVEQAQLDQVCAALATLRPFVPLEIVARTADVPPSLVTSMANDLGRALLVRDGAIQFRDEPTETWFREHFRPGSANLGDFVGRLRPLASSSTYVAAVLPQLMLEAGQFEALVRLALDGGALPEDDPVARRDVELQRLRFALQAALRDKQYEAAAKLSLKAGGEMAAGARQQKLISKNTDLGVHFLNVEKLQEQVSRRQIIGGGWTGSEHVYEAAFLSGSEVLAGDARHQLRLAYGWLDHWTKSLRKEGQREQQVEVADIAEIAWAELNLHGADQSARHLRRWSPRETSFKAGRILVGRLVDAERFGDVKELARAAGNDIGLLLAVAIELAAVGRSPPPLAVRRAVALVGSRHIKIEAPKGWTGNTTLIAAISALVIAAAKARALPRRKLARILTRYLPARPPSSLAGQHANIGGERSALMRAYALRAALANRPLLLERLAAPELRKGLAAKHRSHQDAERFRKEVGALLPWANLWAAVTLERISPLDFSHRISETATESAKAEGNSYSETSATANEIGLLWGETILSMPASDGQWATFDAWRTKLRQPLGTGTLIGLARRAARLEQRLDFAMNLAHEAFDLAAREREDAETKTETLILLARAVLPASLPEARLYFDEAVIASGKIGSENLARWQSILQLGDAASQDGGSDPETAYRFARAAELTYAFVERDKHFDWDHTVETLADISPSSALAILSRWLDRRFGREERLLPAVADRLVARGKLDVRTALALLPMRCGWEPDQLLDKAIAIEPDGDCRAIAARHVVNYTRFSGTVDQLRRIEALLNKSGIDLPEANQAVRLAEARETRWPGNREKTWTSSTKETERNWDDIFDGLNIGSASDLVIAAGRFRAGEPPFRPEEFYGQSMSRVSVGHEAVFIDALCQSQTLTLFDVRSLLEVLPLAWKQRRSVCPALQRLLRQVCRENATAVSADRHYERLPWKLAQEVSGLTMSELMGEAIQAIADTTIPDDAAGLFQLTGILSHQLDKNQAMSALRYGLDLFESSLDLTDGDGPWTHQLQPPMDVERAVAGYLGAALASPEAERRWEAIHAARALCLLQRGSEASRVFWRRFRLSHATISMFSRAA